MAASHWEPGCPTNRPERRGPAGEILGSGVRVVLLRRRHGPVKHHPLEAAKPLAGPMPSHNRVMPPSGFWPRSAAGGRRGIVCAGFGTRVTCRAKSGHFGCTVLQGDGMIGPRAEHSQRHQPRSALHDPRLADRTSCHPCGRAGTPLRLFRHFRFSGPENVRNPARAVRSPAQRGSATILPPAGR